MKDLILKLNSYVTEGNALRDLERQLDIPASTLSKGVTGERAIPMKYLPALEKHFEWYYSTTNSEVIDGGGILGSPIEIDNPCYEGVVGATEKMEDFERELPSIKHLGFNEMLQEFERIIKGINSSSAITDMIKVSLGNLRFLAEHSSILVARQRDAIMSRCDNFLGKNTWRPFAKAKA